MEVSGKAIQTRWNKTILKWNSEDKTLKRQFLDKISSFTTRDLILRILP